MLVKLNHGCLAICMVLMHLSAWSAPLPKGVVEFTAAEGITEYRLHNGLKVLLMPDNGKPTVTVNITYLVGSRFENYGETGMAHLLEHMLFKGTPLLPDIDEAFNQRGMRSNASTSLDHTNYFEQFAAGSDNLHWTIKMEADRMVHSRIAKKDLDSEMTVVRNEYEIGENSAEDVMLKRMQSIVFDWHSYGHPTIGNRSDIENVNIAHLQAFYRMYYQPDNAVLMIAGNFDRFKALQWIAAEFGGIPKPARHLPEFWTVEPDQDGERQFVVRRKGDTQIVMAGYKIPAALDPDNTAVSIAAEMLTANPSGRLYRSLVETGKAVDVFNVITGGYAPGLLVIGAVVKNGTALEPVRDALVSAIEHFADDIPGNEELERIRRNCRNRTEKMISDPDVLSLELSDDIALGDWRFFFQRRNRTYQLTAMQISDAAAKYFRRDNRVVGMFIPDDDLQRAKMPASPGLAEVMQNFQPMAVMQSAEVFDTAPENIDRRVQRLTVGGLQVALLAKKNKGATVSVALDLHWGDEKSLAGKKMIAALTDEMLLRGNRMYSRAQLADELSRFKISGDLSQFDTTGDNLSAALTLVGQILKYPTFPAAEFEQLKQQIVADLESQRSDPNALAVQAMHQHFNHYPENDWRYHASIEESIAAVKAARLEDLESFHRSFYGASHGELSIVGDIDVPVVTEVIQRVFGQWPSPAAYARIDDVYVYADAAQFHIDTPGKENGFYLGQISLDMNDSHKDYPALVVANYIFGGGAELDSRLMVRLRQKQGLSYSGGSTLEIDGTPDAGYLQIEATAAPNNLDRVAAAVLEELKRARRDGFTAAEVAHAKSGFLQLQVQIRSEDDQLSLELNRNQFLGRGFLWARTFEERIKALTVDQVNAAFRTWIEPDRLTVVIAGDEQKSRSEGK